MNVLNATAEDLVETSLINTPSIKVTDKTNVVIDNSFSTSNVFCLGSTVTYADKPAAANDPVTVKAKNSTQSDFVEDALKACDELASKNSKYHNDYVVRGTQALYELLSSIYKLAVYIEQSHVKNLIIKKMRKLLKERGIKSQKNTPVMTVVVKYVVGADRKTAANYSRVLQVAMEENVADEDLAAYISRRGGISRIRDTEMKQHAKKISADDDKERTELVREFLTLQGWDTNHSFKYDGKILIHNPENESKSETASFCLFVTTYDRSSDTYKIVTANDLGKTMEDSLLRMMSRCANLNLDVIRKNLSHYKKKLHTEGKLPPIYDKLLAKEIETEAVDAE